MKSLVLDDTAKAYRRYRDKRGVETDAWQHVIDLVHLVSVSQLIFCLDNPRAHCMVYRSDFCSTTTCR